MDEVGDLALDVLPDFVLLFFDQVAQTHVELLLLHVQLLLQLAEHAVHQLGQVLQLVLSQLLPLLDLLIEHLFVLGELSQSLQSCVYLVFLSLVSLLDYAAEPEHVGKHLSLVVTQLLLLVLVFVAHVDGQALLAQTFPLQEVDDGLGEVLLAKILRDALGRLPLRLLLLLEHLLLRGLLRRLGLDLRGRHWRRWSPLVVAVILPLLPVLPSVASIVLVHWHSLVVSHSHLVELSVVCHFNNLCSVVLH